MKELTCIGCPMGCALAVRMESSGIVVTGNGCMRGAKYAESEMIHPVRMLTSTVEVRDGEIARLSVKTETEIPKEKIMACMREIRRASVEAPVKSGSVVIRNCAGSGVNVIATQNVDKV